MKQGFSILLASLFLIISFQKTLVIGFYELEKEYVIEKLCVNKDVENSCCFGKCFIEKQTSEEKAEGIIINTLKDIKELVYTNQNPILSIVPVFVITRYNVEQLSKLSDFHKPHFHPPNYLV